MIRFMTPECRPHSRIWLSISRVPRERGNRHGMSAPRPVGRGERPGSTTSTYCATTPGSASRIARAAAERDRIVFAGANAACAGLQRPVQRSAERARPGQIRVARAHGQAVRIAHDRARRSRRREVEVARPCAGSARPAAGPSGRTPRRRAHQVEQLRHDRQHALEVAGTEPAAQPVRAPARAPSPRPPAVGIHPRSAGANSSVDAAAAASSRVPLQVARVAVEVLAGPNWSGLTKTRGRRSRCGGRVAEAEVPLVQIAHGRDEADAAAGTRTARRSRSSATVSDGLHSKECSASG
jgi:hypothetical protein